MSDENDIVNGSYKNIPISILSSSIDGGRKVSIKQFPNRDTQSVEDLGLQPRKYSLEIIIRNQSRLVGNTTTESQSYFGYRDALLAALESKEPGILIHPFYGRIESLVAVSYSITENVSSFGFTTIHVDLAPYLNTGIPQSAGNFATEIAEANSFVLSSIATDFTERFSVDTSLLGSFQAAIDKIFSVIDAIQNATSFIGEAAQNLAEFNAALGRLSAKIVGLVRNPLELITQFGLIFENMNGLYASFKAVLRVFQRLFGFGRNDPVAAPPAGSRRLTAAQREINRNNSTINAAVNTAALSYGYLAAVQIDYQTDEEINTVLATLDEQYEAVQNEGTPDTNTNSAGAATGTNDDVKSALADMRVKVFNALQSKRETAAQLIIIETKTVPLRILSYQYYGSDERAETIGSINKINDASFVSGSVRVLTQ